MSDEYKKTWKKFEQTNTIHDLARYLLAVDDAQLISISFIDEEGYRVDLDSKKHERFLAHKKLLKLKDAKQ